MKTQKFALSIMAVSLMSAMSYAVSADSPFSLPSHLTAPMLVETVEASRDVTENFRQEGSTTVSTATGVKPNIMLYIDDSGSMCEGGRCQTQPITEFNQLNETNPTLMSWCNYNYNTHKLDSVYNNEWGVYTNCKHNHTYFVRDQGSRMKVVTDSVTDLLNASDPKNPGKTYADMANWGVFWMNTAGIPVNYPSPNKNVHIINDTSVNDVKTVLETAVAPNARTPLGAGYVRATDWLARSLQYRCQKSYLVMYTDGAANDGKLKALISSGHVPLWKNFNNPRNIDYSGTAYLYELGDYLHNLDFKSAKDGNDKANKSWDDPMFKDQKITTFVMITDGQSQTVQNDTKKMATPNYRDAEGNIVQTAWTVSDDPTDLHNAFQKIFSSIANSQTQNVPGAVSQTQDSRVRQEGDPQAGGGWSVDGEKKSYAAINPAVTGSQGEVVPSEAATVYVYPNLRASELRFYKVNEQGVEGFGLDADENAYTTPSLTVNRYRLFSNATGVKCFHDRCPSNFVSNADVGLPERINGRTDEWQQAMLPWISRRYSDAVIKQRVTSNGYETEYRERDAAEYGMGDVINSNVVAAGRLVGNDPANRRALFLLTNANDGMAYIFQYTGDAQHPYDLKTNYIPTAMPRQSVTDTVGTYYPHIAHPNYVTAEEYPHLYMMDGTITAQTVNLFNDGSPNSSYTYAVGNMGRGARGMYALDLESASKGSDDSITLTNKVSGQKEDMVMFEKTARDDNALGYTVPTSTAGRVKGGDSVHLATFVASGYAYPSVKTQESALYIYNMFGGKDFGINGGTTNKNTGELLKKVTVGNTGGLSAPTLLDINYDGTVDYVFAGDYEGNMWRFDVRNIDNGVPYTKIFEPANKWIDVPESKDATKTVERPARPITSAPAIANHDNGNYVIIFGTGSDLYSDDLHTKRRQAVYGIYQSFNFAGDMGVTSSDKNAIKVGTVNESELQTQDFIPSPDGDITKRYVTNNPIGKDDKNPGYPGWKLFLDNDNGERVVTKPVVALNTVYLTTRWYKENEPQFQGGDFDPTNIDPNVWIQGKTEGGPSEEQLQLCLSSAGDEEGGWSEWKDDPNAGGGGNTGGGSSVTNDPCVSTSTTSNIFRTCEYSYKENTQYTRSTPGEVESKSALIQISSHNGGAIIESERRASGLSFLAAFEGESSTYGYLASQSFDGILAMTITGWTFLNTKDLSGDTVTSNATTQGDVSGSGYLLDPVGGGGNPINKNWMKCGGGADEAGGSLVWTTTAGQQGVSAIRGATMMCGVKRISWREIF